MIVDESLLYKFEKGLNPQRLQDSAITATIIGYGEISAIFRIDGQPALAFKRLPLFSDPCSAERYSQQYHDYCQLLAKSGLHLPDHQTFIVEPPGRPVTVYIAQKMLPPENFAHQLLHVLKKDEIRRLLEMIVTEISKIWHFNHTRHPGLELALDGQLSNWVRIEEREALTVYYIDTSTPLFRKDGVEQLDPELFLKSAPAFLRWIIRLLFLKNVMNRYYDQRLVYIDLAANLHKEQRPDLIPMTIETINRQIGSDQMPLTEEDVKKYYREDKLIWTLFLSFRCIDRWLVTRLFGRRYEFILPGKIKR